MSFRPNKLEDLIGQSEIKESLNICLKAFKNKKKTVPHIIFEGPPGVGKSTLGHILAGELESDCTVINGASIEKPAALIKALVTAEEHDVIFIDEIHAMPSKIAEVLYMPMEDRKLHIIKGSGSNQRAISLPLEDITIFAATTNIGRVPNPLVDRFKLKFFLSYYTDAEIGEIIKRNIAELNINLCDESIESIAKRCKGIPRIANSYLEWVQTYALGNDTNSPVPEMIDAAFKLYGIDEEGFDKNDKKYLDTLENNLGPLGLQALVSMTGIPAKTIEEQIEPFLIRKNLIRKTKSGREAVNDPITQKLERLQNA